MLTILTHTPSLSTALPLLSYTHTHTHTLTLSLSSLSLLQNCPNSIRKRVPQTQFAEKFLHTIPVLQWSKHFTPDQYQRLSQYGGAHGWGGVNIEGVLFFGIC